MQKRSKLPEIVVKELESRQKVEKKYLLNEILGDFILLLSGSLLTTPTSHTVCNCCVYWCHKELFLALEIIILFIISKEVLKKNKT
jgi:hypothetical protein